MHLSEHVLQILKVFRLVVATQILSSELRDPMYPQSTLLRVSSEYLLQELLERSFLFFGELYDHAHVNQHNLHPLLNLLHYFLYLLLVVIILPTKPFEYWRVKSEVY